MGVKKGGGGGSREREGWGLKKDGEKRRRGGGGLFLTGCICVPTHISILRLYLGKNQ